ncbi:hypothetical protein KAR34_03615 [bacterium]|nr:hypothetical protein [bacterium]
MKGFSYTVTPEQIKKHQLRTPLEKLQLLEDFIQFNYSFASSQAKTIQRALRQGKPIPKK